MGKGHEVFYLIIMPSKKVYYEAGDKSTLELQVYFTKDKSLVVEFDDWEDIYSYRSMTLSLADAEELINELVDMLKKIKSTSNG